MHKSKYLAWFMMMLVSLPVLLFAEGPAVHAPADQVKALNAVLLKSLTEGERLGSAGRYALLEPVLEQVFHFPFMVRKSTGRFWKNLDSKQRDTLINKYREWSVGQYVVRFKEDRGQRFEVVASEPVREGIMRVTSYLVKADGEKIALEYLLLKSPGAWRIVDIQVEGVSRLALTRAQFRGVLKQQGYAGLLESLDAKINKLTADDGA